MAVDTKETTKEEPSTQQAHKRKATELWDIISAADVKRYALHCNCSGDKMETLTGYDVAKGFPSEQELQELIAHPTPAMKAFAALTESVLNIMAERTGIAAPPLVVVGAAMALVTIASTLRHKSLQTGGTEVS